MKFLSEVLKVNSFITYIDLSSNNIYKRVRYLSESLNESITSLDLDCNNIKRRNDIFK